MVGLFKDALTSLSFFFRPLIVDETTHLAESQLTCGHGRVDTAAHRSGADGGGRAAEGRARAVQRRRREGLGRPRTGRAKKAAGGRWTGGVMARRKARQKAVEGGGRSEALPLASTRAGEKAVDRQCQVRGAVRLCGPAGLRTRR